MLAHHYAAALDYARATGQDVEPLAERARIALREAGDRAFALNAFPVGRALLRARGSSSGRRTIPMRPSSCSGSLARYHVSGDERQEQSLEAGARRGARSGPASSRRPRQTRCSPRSGGTGGTATRCDSLLDAQRTSGRGTSAVARKGTRAQPGLALPDARRRERGRDPDRRGGARAWPTTSGSTSFERTRSTTSEPRRVNLGDATPGVEDLERSRRARRSRRLARGRTRAQQPRRRYRRASATSGARRELIDEAVRVGRATRRAPAARAFSRRPRSRHALLDGPLGRGAPPRRGVVSRQSEAEAATTTSSASAAIGRAIRLARDDVDGALEDVAKAVELARRCGRAAAASFRGSRRCAIVSSSKPGRADEARAAREPSCSSTRGASTARTSSTSRFVAERARLRRRARDRRRAARRPTRGRTPPISLLRRRLRRGRRDPRRGDRRRRRRAHARLRRRAVSRARAAAPKRERAARAGARVLPLGRRDALHQARPRQLLGDVVRGSRVAPARARSPRRAT